MACYNPIKAYRTPDGVVFSALRRFDILGDIEIACGQCIGCRLRRARDWSVRIMHESQLHEDSCFVTLTYAPRNLPPDMSLRYRDFQLFMKRMRKAFGPRVRFFMCGEYGSLNVRPHYHACLFNVKFVDEVYAGKSESGESMFSSVVLDKLWGFGRCSVQRLTAASAAYTARYVVDKITGDAAVAHYGARTPEFCRCSLKPGIGAEWFLKFGNTDVFPQDFVVLGNKELAAPKYYDKLFRRSKDIRMDSIEFDREKRGRLTSADSTPERLAVREVVQKARVSFLKKDL